MNPAERVIVPLDVPNLQAALELVDRLEAVQFWKVGLELFVSEGPAVLQELKARQKRIFLDLKLHDIPNTMAGACRVAGRYGVDLLTVHAAAGKVALQAAQQAAIAGAEAARLPPPTLLAVTLLTSLDSRALAFQLKVSLDPWDYVQQMAIAAQECDIGGVVCSPQEIEAIRQVCQPSLKIVCPGIRPTWAATGDQRRTLTPAQALQQGANYLVIGRPITQAEDPIAAFQKVCAELGA